MPRRVLLICILLLAFFLRIFRLDSQSFWSDEALSAYSASVPVPLLFTGLPPDQSGAYYFLLQNWIRVAGDVDFTIRFMSVFFGTLSVALAFVLGRRLFSRNVAYIAAFLSAVNPFAVYYSQEARMYSLVLALGTAALYWFVRAVAEPRRRALWIAHAIALGAALYSHYYVFALPMTEGIWLIAERANRNRATLGRWLTSVIGAAVLYSPWTPILPRVLIPRSWPGPVDPTIFPAQLWTDFFAGATMPNEAQAGIFVVVALLLAFGIFCARRRWQGRFLTVFLFLPFAAVLAFLTARNNGLYSRYLIILFPAFILLIAVGIERAGGFRPPFAWGGLVLCSGLAVMSLQNNYFDLHYSRPNWRDAAKWVAAHERQGDFILFDGADPSVEFHRYYRGRLKPQTVPGMRITATDARATERMAPLIPGASRVWLVLAFNSPGRAEEWLNTHGYQGDYEDFVGVYVFPFLFPQDLSPPRRPDRITTGSDINLDSFRVGVARQGDYVPLAVTWRNGAAPEETDYQASVRIVDNQGNLVVALDRAPRDGFHRTSAWKPGEQIEDHYALLIPDKTPPGEYSLQVLLYDPSTGAPHLDATLGTITIGSTGARE